MAIPVHAGVCAVQLLSKLPRQVFPKLDRRVAELAKLQVLIAVSASLKNGFDFVVFSHVLTLFLWSFSFFLYIYYYTKIAILGRENPNFF